MADMSNWTYRKKLTIDNNKIDTALINYPVQVLLNDSNFDFSKAKADGSDIRFADMSNNLLKHEKVEYTQGAAATSLVLYDYGNECTSVTGGWVQINALNGGDRAIKGATYLEYGDDDTSYTVSAFQTTNKIDITQYTVLKAEFEIINNYNYPSGNTNMWGVGMVATNRTENYGIYSDTDAAVYAGAALPAKTVYSCDITSYTGEYYVRGVSQSANYNQETIYGRLYKVWLEKPEIPSIGKFNVQVPSISDTVDTEMYMYYGNANAHNTSIEAWQDQTGKALTYNGNVKMGWDSGLGRRVAQFDGSGDYFTVPDSEDWNFGSGDFCIEMLVNHSSLPASTYQVYFSQETPHAARTLFYKQNSTNKLVFASYNTSALAFYETTTQISASTLYHLSIVRQGVDLRIYINGVSDSLTVATPIGSNVLLNIASVLSIGTELVDGTTPSYSMYGVIRGMRITKGRARYTANFTPPTSFEIDGTDVVFCTNFDTIYDNNFVMVQHMGDTLVDASGNGNNGTNTGTAVVDTTYGKARSFNGTSSYIIVADSASLDSPTHEITLQTFTNIITGNMLVEKYQHYYTYVDSTTGNQSLAIYQSGNSAFFETYGVTNIKSSNATFAGRYSSNTDMHDIFVNGVLDNSVSRVLTDMSGYVTNNALSIGRRSFGSIGNYTQGVIMEIRISNIARTNTWIKADDYTLRQLNLYTTGAEQDLRVTPPVSLSPSATNIRHDVNNTFSFYYESVIGVGLSSYEIDYRAVGAPTWVSSGVVTSNAPSGTIIQYVINANSFQKDVSYEWRARVTNTLSVTSEYATSTFGTYVSPSATGSTPSFATLNAYANQTLTWAYSDPLSSAQTKYEVKYTNVSTGISTTTGEVTSNAVTHTLVAKTLAYASDPLYTWEVRVWNTEGDVSDWSTPLQFTYFQPYEASGTFTTAEVENEGRVWIPASILFTVDTPTGTSIVAEARSTLDGTTYTAWTTVTNGSTWTEHHSKIQLRFTLNSHTSGLITPKILSYAINYQNQYEETGTWTSDELDISSMYNITTTYTPVETLNSGSIVYEKRYRKNADDNWSAWSTTDSVGNIMQIRAIFTQPTERHLTPTIDSLTILMSPEKKQSVWLSEIVDVSQAKDLTNSKAVFDSIYHGGQVTVYSRSKATIDGAWSDWYLSLEDGTLLHPSNVYIQLMVILVGEAEVREMTLSLDGDASVEVIKAGMTPGATYSFTILDDLALIANGNDQPLKWDSINPPTILNADPPILSMVLTHHNRAWGVDSETPSRLRYSNILDPTVWDAYDFIDFNPDDGDMIMAIVRYGQNLVISKQRSMALLTGNRSSNYNVSWLDSESGATGMNAICVADKYLVYVAQDGIRFTDLAQSVIATERLNPSWAGINKRRLNQAALVYWKNRLFAALPSEGSLYNDTVWVYDFLRNSWSIIDGWEVSTWQKFNQYGEDILLAGDSTTGQLYHVDVTSYDDTIPVEYEWRSKDFNFKAPEKYKLFRNVFLDLEGVAETTNLYVDLIVDGDIKGTYNTTIPAGEGVKHTRRVLPPIYGAVLGSAFGLRIRGRCGVQSITIQYAIRGNIPGGEL